MEISTLLILTLLIITSSHGISVQDDSIPPKFKEMILNGIHNIGVPTKFTDGVGEIDCLEHKIDGCNLPGNVSVHVTPYMAMGSVSIDESESSASSTTALVSLLTHIYGAHGGSLQLSVILRDGDNTDPLPVVFLGTRFKIVNLFVALGHIYIVYYDFKPNECRACLPTKLTVREFRVSNSGGTRTIVEVDPQP